MGLAKVYQLGGSGASLGDFFSADNRTWRYGQYLKPDFLDLAAVIFLHVISPLEPRRPAMTVFKKGRTDRDPYSGANSAHSKEHVRISGLDRSSS